MVYTAYSVKIMILNAYGMMKIYDKIAKVATVICKIIFLIESVAADYVMILISTIQLNSFWERRKHDVI